MTIFFSDEVINFHEDYDSILESSETLMDFLIMNYLDHELIMAFSEITLEPKVSDQIKKRIEERNPSIFKLEENLLDIQKKVQYYFIEYQFIKNYFANFYFQENWSFK